MNAKLCQMSEKFELELESPDHKHLLDQVIFL